MLGIYQKRNTTLNVISTQDAEKMGERGELTRVMNGHGLLLPVIKSNTQMADALQKRVVCIKYVPKTDVNAPNALHK